MYNKNKCFIFNKNNKRRCEILGIIYTENDIRILPELDIKTVLKLVRERFIDLNKVQNESPKVREFIKFMLKYPNCKAISYMISPSRPDYRISIKGLRLNNRKIEFEITKEFIEDFKKFSKNSLSIS